MGFSGIGNNETKFGKENSMKTLRRKWAALMVALALAGAALCALYGGLSAWGQTAPGIVIAPSGTNQLAITVTNAATGAFYYLWWTPSLNDPAYPWQVLQPGNPGQTNFNVSTSNYPWAYFQVSIGNSTGVPPWEAANPSDPSSPILTVYINTPANGAVVQ